MKKVLIIDDSLYMRTVLKDIVQETVSAAGLEAGVIEAEAADEALVKWREERPDLTFLDIVMPEGEDAGVQVLKTIRQEDLQAKVVMISAVGQKAVMDVCQKLGVDDYIVKPFDNSIVEAVVKKFL
ncbi:MAG: response regulator [Elusimicrobia bacterium]|nr:response regulator [Candidatus Obscuribacterium magneticum]